MQFQEITATGTTTLKKQAGFLQGFVVNLGVATTTIQLFDSLTGSGQAIAGGGAAFALPTVAGTLFAYDCHFSNGLTIVVGGSGTFSITISWY